MALFFVTSAILLIFANKATIKTTLTLEVNNESILPSLKKVLEALPGIKVIQHREKEADPTLMTMEELDAKIEKAHQELKEGKCKTVRSDEDLEQFLDSL